MSETSTKPYLLRAIYEWCTDNGFTPYLAVLVDGQTRVPMQFVKNGEIVLNISFDATSALKMDNDVVRFSARFGGVSRDISVPVENVIAIYARENGQGMAFEVSRFPARDNEIVDGSDGNDAVGSVTEMPSSSAPTLTSVPSGQLDQGSGSTPDDDPEPPKKGGRPTLTRIK
ncbi:ClpXP protease specificity-enhancing factor [Actimicrobium antarcticum]|uniref:ClpXP protease specificity-enhancing factor n=1 Tax=Actimicrobium antarcticum TaxID=1051899 RepID=A0ABP7TVQ6_9BURK